MPAPDVKQPQADLLVQARRAGLEKAVTEFPQDVLVAAEAAARARGAFSAPDSSTAEPWPPMRPDTSK